MASIYDLNAEFEIISELLSNPDLTDEEAETLQTALDCLGEDLDYKLENYAKVIRNFESDIEGLKKEEDRIRTKRQTLEKRISDMKTAMRDAMIAMIAPDEKGKIRTKCGAFSFSIRNNAPSVVMDEQYIENIPEKYLIAQEPKIDRKLLAEDLKADGAALEGIAHLESSQSILIK